MKIKSLVFVTFSIILMITAYYVNEWTDEFVDPACDGRHGQCPPSYWECSFMGSVSAMMMLIAVVILLFGIFEFKEGDK